MSPADIVIQQHNLEVEIANVIAEYIAQNGLEFSAVGVILFSIGYIVRRVLRARATKNL